MVWSSDFDFYTVTVFWQSDFYLEVFHLLYNYLEISGFGWVKLYVLVTDSLMYCSIVGRLAIPWRVVILVSLGLFSIIRSILFWILCVLCMYDLGAATQI